MPGVAKEIDVLDNTISTVHDDISISSHSEDMNCRIRATFSAIILKMRK
jgi:hypothetical protein